ncbi:hypothetical protein [Zhouia amylolytica]|uniref:Uncharacterized protein n=1 Tax=Zhouia amylolytica AD3 TaxID=1286632 RepID=W2UKV7_9FLAO|nr:hypothetical protein [Zhouia amylolytica]ETN94765.1 hypothetical protein P278_27080 [Zhouia amylolytica AD3]
MTEQLPVYIKVLFGLTVLITLVWFFKAVKSKSVLIVIIIWTLIQTVLGLNGFYQDTTHLPPRILLVGVFPPLILIAITFFTRKGKLIMNQMDLKILTNFHVIRVPVEIVLALLFSYELVSVYMTYHGTNFDLLSGLTAPIIGFIAFKKEKVNNKLLLIWNIVCLLLLLNVVITAAFALPSPFQKIALNQPNVALLYFPFNLLPSVIVPLVLFAHLVAIKRIIK